MNEKIIIINTGEARGPGVRAALRFHQREATRARNRHNPSAINQHLRSVTLLTLMNKVLSYSREVHYSQLAPAQREYLQLAVANPDLLGLVERDFFLPDGTLDPGAARRRDVVNVVAFRAYSQLS